jgi:hypothetical protein
VKDRGDRACLSVGQAIWQDAEEPVLPAGRQEALLEASRFDGTPIWCRTIGAFEQGSAKQLF